MKKAPVRGPSSQARGISVPRTHRWLEGISVCQVHRLHAANNSFTDQGRDWSLVVGHAALTYSGPRSGWERSGNPPGSHGDPLLSTSLSVAQGVPTVQVKSGNLMRAHNSLHSPCHGHASSYSVVRNPRSARLNVSGCSNDGRWAAPSITTWGRSLSRPARYSADSIISGWS